MSSFTKVPCAECGTMTIAKNGDTDPQYCDSFCQARSRVNNRRNGGTIPSASNTNLKSRVVRGRTCGSCNSKKI